jgi:hypothetical protein
MHENNMRMSLIYTGQSSNVGAHLEAGDVHSQSAAESREWF